VSAAARIAALGLSLAAAAAGVIAGAALTTATSVPADAATMESSVEPGGADAVAGRRLAAADAVIADAVPLLVGDSLSARVSVVGLGPAAGPASDLVAADLRTAGATVTSVVVLDDGWIDPALATLRSGLAGQLTGGRGDDSLNTALALAIGGGDADGSSGGSSTVLAALQGAGILTVVEAPGPAVLTPAPTPVLTPVLTPAPTPAPTPSLVVTVFVTSGPVSGDAAAGWSELLSIWRSTVPATAAIAAEYGSEARAGNSSLVVGIRQGPLASAVATVDHAGTGLGRVAVIRAAYRLPQQPVGHYGFLSGAGAELPPAPGTERTSGAGGNG